MKKSFFCALALAALTAALRAQTAEALLQAGDALDAKNDNRAALPIYLEAEKIRSDDAAVLRRIAKQYSQLVSETSDKREQKQLAERSVDYALRAKKLAPADAEVRLSLAICIGKLAFFEPPRQRIEMSRLIRDEAEVAVRLDPSEDYAWHVLGRWNYELANFNPALKLLASAIYGKLPDASNARAAECFERAIAAGPPRVIHHTELGRTYATLGRKDDARRQLEKALSLPLKEKDDSASKDRARQALKSL